MTNEQGVVVSVPAAKKVKCVRCKKMLHARLLAQHLERCVAQQTQGRPARATRRQFEETEEAVAERQERKHSSDVLDLPPHLVRRGYFTK